MTGSPDPPSPPPGITVRVAVPGDADALAGLLASLSGASLRQRFAGAPPPPGERARYARLDPPGTLCVVAEDAEQPGLLVGEARCLTALCGGPPELAMIVRDSHQGRGVGRMLLTALCQRAAAGGAYRLQAEVLLSNTPMLRLLAPWGLVTTSGAAEGTVIVEVSTRGEIEGWPEEAAGRRVLVEGGSWFDTAQVRALAASGADVRRCPGPRTAQGRDCALIASGRCRLLEEADLVVTQFRAGDPAGQAVLEARMRRPAQRPTQ